jgi:hypothetical protein
MRIEFDARLMEEAVFLAVRQAAVGGASDRATAYRRRLDTVYDLPPGSRERERGFRVLHAAWFDALGLHARVAERVAEVPVLAGGCDRLLVDTAPTRRQEGAELFVRRSAGGAARTTVLRLRASLLCDAEAVRPFLRRELQHCADMVDPGFGYRPTLDGAGDPARESLWRDRYRVCWDASVDGRLVRAGRLPGVSAADHRPPFARAFAALGPEAAAALCDAAFATDAPTHAQFVAWAATGAPVPGLVA